MMKPEVDKTDVGVIVGRFQVPHLHEAHCELIQTVCSQHPKVIVILGLSPCKTTFNNPLDFEARKQMLLEKFPNLVVAYVKDCASDEVWSERVDEVIGDLSGPNQKVTLYGSRDSFIPHYKGRYKTQRLEQRVYISGSELRKAISNQVKSSPDFRAGVIWAMSNMYAKVHPTVDVAILNEDTTQVLMARKPNETLWRFVGGFAQGGGSYEDDARRETLEETCCETSIPEYIGSCTVDDWRYRKEADKIKTLFFKAKYLYGAPKAKDDIAALRWFDLSTIHWDDLVKEHHPLLDLLFKNLNIRVEEVCLRNLKTLSR